MLASYFYHKMTTSKLPVIVCLHGLLGSSEDWSGCTELLTDYPLLCIDLPGHGLSQHLHCDDFKMCCDQISHVLRHHIPSQAPIVLLGYSLGARIFMNGLARNYFNAFNIKLLICESGHFGLKSDEQKRQRFSQDYAWAARFTNEALETVLDDWYQQPVFQSLSQMQRNALINKRLKNVGTSVASTLMATTLAKQDYLLDLLKNSNIPIHCICGEKDNKFKQLNEYSGLPYSFIHQAGHNAHIDDPQAFTNIVKSNVSALWLDAN